uniref:Uncharacterized protein n=1 Tax=Glossina palpalis gambiensis TaxID=67801 RepID=A0A1B0BVX8_9MUSC
MTTIERNQGPTQNLTSSPKLGGSRENFALKNFYNMYVICVGLFKFIRSGGLNPLLENESFPMKRVYEISILQITRPNVREKSVGMPLAYFQTPSHSLILSTTFFWQSKTFFFFNWKKIN